MNLYQKFKNLDDYYEKYNVSFPIGVFGTLRQLPCNQGNAARMYCRQPIAHKKAFIPHYTANGIWLEFKENASGALELYYYTPEDFLAVIKWVDALERFNPDHAFGYFRTLIEVRILPDDYEHQLFNEGIDVCDRDLKIPKNKWDFPCVPAWVYSNAEANNACLSCLENSPILWWQDEKDEKCDCKSF